MFTTLDYLVREASESDRTRLTSLIQLEPYVHRHLDWRPPLDWLGHQPYIVAEKGRNLIAALACPTDPEGVAWIRTFAAAGHVSASRAWRLLWPEVERTMQHQPDTCVAAIPLYKWFRKLLIKSGFSHTHNVVLLSWEGQSVPPPKRTAKIRIRSMELGDLAAVTTVDNAAFEKIWRNSDETLRLAFMQSVSATVAENESGIIGYQISTPNPYGWHLARLAVHPRNQRQGIAYALVRNLLSEFLKQGTRQVTVNTPHTNIASLRLYKEAGFRRTGEEYPVYQYFFDGSSQSSYIKQVSSSHSSSD